MNLVYTEGPDMITVGIAGEFRRGEPKEVEDSVAEKLLKKQSIKFAVADAPKKRRA